MTELVFILDRSGSMSGLEENTIDGFNSMLEQQRSESGEVLVSTVLFDDVSTVIHNRVPLATVNPLTRKDYFVRGSTALLDAVGSAIRHIANIHQYARKEDIPEKTLFIITTDGMENASIDYTYGKVRKLIERQRVKFGWEFIFLGANIDAEQEAKRFGIDESMATNYHSDKQGTDLNYRVLSKVVSDVRQGGRVSVLWKKEIDEDYMKRRNK